jgi:hypothetical protein
MIGDRFDWRAAEPAGDSKAGYAVRDRASGFVLAVYSSPVDARRECERLNGKYRDCLACQPVPAAAHASVDAMFSEEDQCWGIDDRVTLSIDDVPLFTLGDTLDIEADLLEREGTIGPNARAILAALVRDVAEVAKVTGAASVEQAIDRRDTVEGWQR